MMAHSIVHTRQPTSQAGSSKTRADMTGLRFAFRFRSDRRFPTWQGIFLAGVTALTAAAPAHADWQYTRWGMTPAEVVAASGGEVAPVSSTRGDNVIGQRLAAEGSFLLNGQPYRAQFYFSPMSDGLSVIRLHPRDQGLCYILPDELDGIFGRSVIQGRSPVTSRTWTDPERNLSLMLTQFNATCFLSYTPIAGTARGDF